MFNKILVALDGSDISMKALGAAIDEAKVWKADLHAVYVVETGMLASIPPDNIQESIYSLLEKEGNDIITESVKRAAASGITLTSHIAEGHAGSMILDVAREVGADIIVLGSTGKSNIDRLLVGSVTSYVVRHSDITTLVVRS